MSEKRESPIRWLIVAFFTLFMAIMTYNLIVFPACAVDTMETFGIGQSGLTILASITSVVGLFTGIFFGRQLDTRDVRKTILLYMVIGVALFFVRAVVSIYPVVVALTFLASACIGVCQIAAPKVLSTWFPPGNVGTAISFMNAGGGIGSAGGFALGAVLGIRQALVSIGIAYLALLLLWVAVGREGPYKMAAPPVGQEAKKGNTKAVFSSKYLWMITLAFSLAVSCSLLVNTYMINAFLSKGFEPTQASLMATVLNLALMLGGFVMTAFVGIVKRFNLLLCVAMLGGAVFVLMSWFMPISLFTWVFVALGGLFFGGSLGLCAGRIPLIPMTGQFPAELVGTASGFCETVKGVISFVMPIVIASALGTNYNGIFIVFAVCCALCILCGSILVPELGEKGKLFQKFQSGSNAARQ